MFFSSRVCTLCSAAPSVTTFIFLLHLMVIMCVSVRCRRRKDAVADAMPTQVRLTMAAKSNDLSLSTSPAYETISFLESSGFATPSLTPNGIE